MVLINNGKCKHVKMYCPILEKSCIEKKCTWFTLDRSCDIKKSITVTI